MTTLPSHLQNGKILHTKIVALANYNVDILKILKVIRLDWNPENATHEVRNI